jgi:hypothetical protein
MRYSGLLYNNPMKDRKPGLYSAWKEAFLGKISSKDAYRKTKKIIDELNDGRSGWKYRPEKSLTDDDLNRFRKEKD